MNSPIVNQDVVHLKIGFFARLAFVKFDEGVLQTIPGRFIPDNLAAADNRTLRRCTGKQLAGGLLRRRLGQLQVDRVVKLRYVPVYFSESTENNLEVVVVCDWI